MHILIGLALGVALLYFWLIGNWFARVLVFLALAVAVFIVASLAINYGVYDGKAPLAVLFIEVPMMALAWPLAGLPIYYWRWRIRRMTQPVYR